MKNINKRYYQLLLLIGFAQMHDTHAELPVNNYTQMSENELEKALGLAVEKNNLDSVQALIAAKANINGKITYTQHNYDDYDTYITCSFIEYAAQHGYVNIVKELIKAKAKIDDVNAALILAASKGHADIVTALVQVSNININFTDRLDHTALLQAAKNADGMGTNAATGRFERKMGNMNYLEVIKTLIKAGAHVNYHDSFGDTPLIKLLQNARPYKYTENDLKLRAEIIQALLKAGANINHANEHGNTALIIAINNHDLHAVQNLLKTPKLNINYADKNGNTALMIAIICIQLTYRSGNTEEYHNCLNSQSIVTLLLNTPGTNLHHANKKGDTALTLLEKLDAQMHHRNF